jgi:N-acyl-L-homoserine lactone synthetase
MHVITFDFLGQHRHGTAFAQFLALRKRFFVDQLGWDVPHDEAVEMDQYDNPCAHYALAVEGGQVVGGARIMPTSARWGRHTYMLGDARRGEIDIPRDALPDEVVSRDVWECTRLVVSDLLRSQAERTQCLSLIVSGLVEIARDHGGLELVSLSPLPLMRALRQLGYPASRLGEPYESGDGRRYAVLRMPAIRSSRMMAAE